MMHLIVALAAASTPVYTKPPRSCPGPLQGIWFRSDYRCDSVVEVEWPRAPDTLKHREWSVTYLVDGNAVTVTYDGRWRDYEDYKPRPAWNKGRPHVRQMLVTDRCTAITDRVWPRTVYREESGCRAPHGAYSWTPGAPRGTLLPAAVYEGIVRPDGTMSLSLDPHSRIFGPRAAASLATGPRKGRVRFIGEEPFDPVEGKLGRQIAMLVDLDTASILPTGSAELGTLMVERARSLADAGHRREASREFARAASMLARPANGGRDYRPERIAIQSGILARDLLVMEPNDSGWEAQARKVESELRTVIAETAYRGYLARPADRAAVLGSDAALVADLLRNEEGRSESERIRSQAEAIAKEASAS